MISDPREFTCFGNPRKSRLTEGEIELEKCGTNKRNEVGRHPLLSLPNTDWLVRASEIKSGWVKNTKTTFFYRKSVLPALSATYLPLYAPTWS